MKNFILFFVLYISIPSFSQFTPSLAYKASIIDVESHYYKSSIIVSNPNDTYDYYIVHNDLNPVLHTLSLRSFGKKYLVDKTFNFGYSLAIGLQHFTSSSKLLYDYSSTTYRDSIINAFNGYTYRTNYSMVFSTHFFDFNWNISERIRFSQSIGVGFVALMRAKSRNVANSSIVDNDYPIMLSISYEPQILEKYEKFDVSYFLSFNLFNLGLYNWKDDDQAYWDTRMKISDMRFNGIGIRFFPHMKLKPIAEPIVD